MPRNVSEPTEPHVSRKRSGKAPSLARRRNAPRSLSAAKLDVDEYLLVYARATPVERIDAERRGISGAFIKVLSKRMKLPATRVFAILGIPRATAEKKAATGELLVGSGGHAAMGMLRLLSIVSEMVANSTAKEAEDFDAPEWLGRWIERPQASLGGRKPADMLDTPTGVNTVARLLKSLESGSYQ